MTHYVTDVPTISLLMYQNVLNVSLAHLKTDRLERVVAKQDTTTRPLAHAKPARTAVAKFVTPTILTSRKVSTAWNVSRHYNPLLSSLMSVSVFQGSMRTALVQELAFRS